MSKEIRNKPNVFNHQLFINDQNLSEKEFLQECKSPELQFCRNDFRKLKYYIPELQIGSFVIEIYTDSLEHISGDPDKSGWLCSSKTLYVYNGYVYENGQKIERLEYSGYTGFHTKAVFTIRKIANKKPNNNAPLEIPSITFSQ